MNVLHQQIRTNSSETYDYLFYNFHNIHFWHIVLHPEVPYQINFANLTIVNMSILNRIPDIVEMGQCQIVLQTLYYHPKTNKVLNVIHLVRHSSYSIPPWKLAAIIIRST